MKKDIDKTPLISCICATNDRIKYLEKAVACFERQSYPRKELLITCLDSDLSTQKWVIDHCQENSSIRLHIVESAEKPTLGGIRNQAIKVARGEYICVWDDDDFYHDQRLVRSVDAIKETGKRGVVLANVVIHDSTRKRSYMSVTRLWEQTLVFEREYLISNRIWYADLNRGEDSALVSQICNELYVLKDPVIYIYNYHSENTCDSNHFESHFKVGQRMNFVQENYINDLLYSETTSTVSSLWLDSKAFLETLPLVGKNDCVAWGARPFSIFPKLIVR